MRKTTCVYFLTTLRDAINHGPANTQLSLQLIPKIRLNEQSSDTGASSVNQTENGRYILFNDHCLHIHCSNIMY